MTHNAFNADCMEIMSRYPDKWFDLVVVDPPYGIGQPKQSNLKGYNGRADLQTRLQKNRLNYGAGKLKGRVLNQSNTEWDNNIPDDDYFIELFRVSKNQIIWGGNYFGLPATRCVICWDKMQPWENFSQWEMAWTSFDSPARIYKFDNRTGDKLHPTQKPIALYDWIFKNYLPNGGRVLDTHGGSMSSLISAIKAGNIEMTISELDADYYASAQKRVNDFMSQLNLFQERPNIIW
jgi:site-specific DNA-methyltransferase (adenine-specific)